jgi:hypothetical protein
VAAKLAVSPPGILFSRMLKKQAVDLGRIHLVDKIFKSCYFGSANSKNGAKMELAVPKIEQQWYRV